jgi:hypothetical protein
MKRKNNLNFPTIEILFGIFGLILLRFLRNPVNGKKRDIYDYVGILVAWGAIIFGFYFFILYLFKIIVS